MGVTDLSVPSGVCTVSSLSSPELALAERPSCVCGARSTGRRQARGWGPAQGGPRRRPRPRVGRAPATDCQGARAVRLTDARRGPGESGAWDSDQAASSPAVRVFPVRAGDRRATWLQR